jgi:hypothetical protein
VGALLAPEQFGLPQGSAMALCEDGEQSNVGAAGGEGPDTSGEEEIECNESARRGGFRRDGIAEVSHPSHVP